jgi:hypothetical protein
VTKHRNYRQATGFASKKNAPGLIFFAIIPPHKKTNRRKFAIFLTK